MPTLLTPFVREPAKHLYLLLRRPAYRTFCRLCSRYGRVPRYSRREVRLQGWRLVVPDCASFLSAYQSIFLEEAYAFTAGTECPRILDCGANIGLSVLFFKTLYPKARITAFEADREIFDILRHNVHGNGLTDVELVHAAVWSSRTTVRFRREGADAGRVEADDRPGLVEVPAVRLRDYLVAEPIELLKMDIEGAEVEVVRDCEDVLDNVRAAFAEHHSFVGKPQELGSLISRFENNGFRTHARPGFSSPSPLREVHTQPDLNMDLQLNLYFFRPGKVRASATARPKSRKP